ncbi:hypothetical protein AB0L44_15070 [Nonomuraea wenchangensis]|uniref:hypothetical protein n=1 Tax=Nonomuraea wenchangensis TaxID=568860 RepID=UPI003447D42F
MTSAPGGDTPTVIAINGCVRLATHLDLLSHQLGEASLEPVELQHLAAALQEVKAAVARTATAAGLLQPDL